ncbi:putative mitochondrial protein [Cucumis melo var. makuwa]|uniref:Mitochondrial protein n=1 Tax=Cucumis melo var. makuwa TaxID=1194695 RepID=A0A5A7UEQ6_CUCMM|nr:putative mitochondrial protein [Cucumis melo var. makuwa]TYK19123.1 putative mitochondrial protein [Cucumis melo var. makuwa]
MARSDRENKKGKRIAFKSIYEKETTVNQSDNEANMDESIALLTKQFSKVVRKFKNMNTIGSSVQNSNQYRRKDGENTTRRQKKNYHATLSNENTDDTEDDSGMNAFTTCFNEIDLGNNNECFDGDGDEDFTFEELKMLRKEDTEVRAIQKERIQDLMEENEQLMSVISFLKLKLKENSSNKYGLGFDASRTYDEDDETLNMPVDSSMLPEEVPKADAQVDGAGINSKTISKEVIADNYELVPSAHVRNNHPSSSIIGDPSVRIITRKKEKVDYSKMIAGLCYTSAIKPSTFDVALEDEY